MKILIFDSDMLIRNDLKIMFQLHGMPATCTGSLKKALSLMASGAYSIIVAGISPYAESIPDFVKAVKYVPLRLTLIVGISHRAATMHLRTISAYIHFPFLVGSLDYAIDTAINNKSTRAISIAN